MQTLTEAPPRLAPALPLPRRAWGIAGVAAAALGGVALAAGGIGAIVFQAEGMVPPPVVAFVVAALLASAAIARGWRPAPASAVLVGGAALAMTAPMLHHLYVLPPDSMLLPMTLAAASGAVAVLAGIAGTVQNYRRSPEARRVPVAARAALLAWSSVVAGAVAVAAIPRPGATAGVSPQMLATLPALPLKNFEFGRKEIRARVGETVALRLVNGDPATHSFDIDELGVHAPIAPGASALALFRPTRPGRYTLHCAPHYDRRTGQGMKGTLIVEP